MGSEGYRTAKATLTFSNHGSSDELMNPDFTKAKKKKKELTKDQRLFMWAKGNEEYKVRHPPRSGDKCQRHDNHSTKILKPQRSCKEGSGGAA